MNIWKLEKSLSQMCEVILLSSLCKWIANRSIFSNKYTQLNSHLNFGGFVVEWKEKSS